MFDFLAKNFDNNKEDFVVILDNSNVVSMNRNNNDHHDINLKKFCLYEQLNDGYYCTKKDPKYWTTVVDRDGLKEESNTKTKEDTHSIGRDVRVSDLIELHEHEDGDEIHEGGVELEGDVGGADVVAAGHDALHEQSQTQSIVEWILGGDTKLLLHYALVLVQEVLILQLFDQDYPHEEETECTVSQVAEHMIEVPHQAQGLPAEIIVVADVLVPGDTLLVGECEHHLQHGESIEETDQEEDAEVELGLLID